MAESTSIVHPKHYANYAIEPLTFILANDIPFCEGNVIKYVCRWKDKGGVADLKKAREYLDRLISKHEDLGPAVTKPLGVPPAETLSALYKG